MPRQTGGDVKPVKCFTGGDQGFVSLVLANVEEINHNTKKFRFHLPEDGSTSGLNVACTTMVPLLVALHILTCTLSCSHHQVQGSGDAKTRHPTLHSHQ